MRVNEKLQTSALHAQVLLEAWNCGDLNRFRQGLDVAEPVASSSEWPCVEEERWELLSSVVSTLRAAMQRTMSEAGNCEFEVSMQMLRHLVQTH